MFEVYWGNVNLAVLTLIISVVFVLPAQLLLCFKAPYCSPIACYHTFRAYYCLYCYEFCGHWLGQIVIYLFYCIHRFYAFYVLYRLGDLGHRLQEGISYLNLPNQLIFAVKNRIVRDRTYICNYTIPHINSNSFAIA